MECDETVAERTFVVPEKNRREQHYEQKHGEYYIIRSSVIYAFDQILLQTNYVALSPRANYTATCLRNLVPTFVDRGVLRGQRGGSPTVVNLSFPDRSRYFPHLLSQGLSGPRSRPTATQKIW
jgi:hypothetical protein